MSPYSLTFSFFPFPFFPPPFILLFLNISDYHIHVFLINQLYFLVKTSNQSFLFLTLIIYKCIMVKCSPDLFRSCTFTVNHRAQFAHCCNSGHVLFVTFAFPYMPVALKHWRHVI